MRYAIISFRKEKRGYETQKEKGHTAMNIVSVQTAFDKEIPDNIRGNSEYAIEVEVLQNMDRLLRESGAEEQVIRSWLSQAEAENGLKTLTDKARVKIQQGAICALRTAVLRKYRNLSYRQFARELALAPLYQWFCKLNRWVDVQIPGKSKLQSDEQNLPEGLVRELGARLVSYSMAESSQAGSLGTEDKLDLSKCFFDSF